MADSPEETADILCAYIAVIVYDAQADVHDILLVRLANEGARNSLALPGGRKDAADGGHIRRTAIRKLAEQFGISLATEARLRVLDAVDGNGRTSIILILEALPQEAASARAGIGTREIVRMRLRDVNPRYMAFDQGGTIRRLLAEYH